MTARLKDQAQLADRNEAEAARLLGVLSPSEPDPVMESRVYAKLMAQPGRTLQGWQRGWVVACVGLLLVGTTVLAAVLVHRWLVNPRSARNLSPVGATALPAPQRPGDQPAREPSHQATLPSADPGVVVSPLPIAPPGEHAVAPHPVHAVKVRRRSAGPGHLATSGDEAAAPEMQGRAAETSSSEARMAAAPSEEAALVLSALRALRRGHDPVQAGALLDQYLARFSRGVLGEEALALGMEAALDRNDTTAAARLADQYMRRYPAGRFTDLARRAMGSKGP